MSVTVDKNYVFTEEKETGLFEIGPEQKNMTHKDINNQETGLFVTDNENNRFTTSNSTNYNISSASSISSNDNNPELTETIGDSIKCDDPDLTETIGDSIKCGESELNETIADAVKCGESDLTETIGDAIKCVDPDLNETIGDAIKCVDPDLNETIGDAIKCVDPDLTETIGDAIKCVDPDLTETIGDAIKCVDPDLTETIGDAIKCVDPDLTETIGDAIKCVDPDLTETIGDAIKCVDPDLTETIGDAIKCVDPDLTENIGDAIKCVDPDLTETIGDAIKCVDPDPKSKSENDLIPETKQGLLDYETPLGDKHAVSYNSHSRSYNDSESTGEKYGIDYNPMNPSTTYMPNIDDNLLNNIVNVQQQSVVNDDQSVVDPDLTETIGDAIKCVDPDLTETIGDAIKCVDPELNETIGDAIKCVDPELNETIGDAIKCVDPELTETIGDAIKCVDPELTETIGDAIKCIDPELTETIGDAIKCVDPDLNKTKQNSEKKMEHNPRNYGWDRKWHTPLGDESEDEDDNTVSYNSHHNSHHRSYNDDGYDDTVVPKDDNSGVYSHPKIKEAEEEKTNSDDEMFFINMDGQDNLNKEKKKPIIKEINEIISNVFKCGVEYLKAKQLLLEAVMYMLGNYYKLPNNESMKTVFGKDPSYPPYIDDEQHNTEKKSWDSINHKLIKDASAGLQTIQKISYNKKEIARDILNQYKDTWKDFINLTDISKIYQKCRDVECDFETKNISRDKRFKVKNDEYISIYNTAMNTVSEDNEKNGKKSHCLIFILQILGKFPFKTIFTTSNSGLQNKFYLHTPGLFIIRNPYDFCFKYDNYGEKKIGIQEQIKKKFKVDSINLQYEEKKTDEGFVVEDDSDDEITYHPTERTYKIDDETDRKLMNKYKKTLAYKMENLINEKKADTVEYRDKIKKINNILNQDTPEIPNYTNVKSSKKGKKGKKGKKTNNTLGSNQPKSPSGYS